MKNIHLLFVLSLALAACQPTTPTGPPTVTVSSLADAGAGSLRETLSSAEAGSVVSLKGLTGTLTLASELVVSKNLTLEGGAGVVLSGDGKTRVLNVAAGSNLTLKGVKLTGGKSLAATSSGLTTRAAVTGQGGIIFNAGTLVIQTGTEVSGGEAMLGGGIFNAGTLTLEGGVIKNNKVVGAIGTTQEQGYGGGIYNAEAGTLSISSGDVQSNSATVIGGGIHNEGTFKMTAGNIEANSAAYTGAGVENIGSGVFSFSGGTIQSNTATGAIDPQESYGGGVANEATFNMTGGTIKGNKATRAGAGVVNWKTATFTMTNGTIEGNQTTGTVDNGGGGILNYLGIFKMSGGTIQNNTSMYAGGVNNWGMFEMSGGVVQNNTAKNGAGGVGNTLAAAVFKFTAGTISGNSGSFTMAGGTISSNKATQNGGGVHTDGGATFLFENGIIENNTATGAGGGIINYKATLTMAGGTIRGNTANNGGGVFTDGDAASKGSFTLNAGSITGNTATLNGGGVFVGANGTFTNNGVAVTGNTPNNIFPAP
jgi:hypothetical protein